MKIKTLFNENEHIDIESYLHKHNIMNTKEFIDGSPKYVENSMLYSNIEKGIELIKRYINKKIYLLIDCDLDGYTSGAELYLYLKQLNPDANIEPLIHQTKMHGLDDQEIMQYLLSQPSSLLIIPDASGREKDYKTLVESGYEILVLDHHNIKDSTYATVINNQLSLNVVNKQASGAVVTHQFLRALDIHFDVKYAWLYTDIAMLGNISDIMNMANYYNRTYNYYGFRNIKNPFIQGLIDKFVDGDLTPHKVAFNITPKFNAVIRSDNYQLKKDVFSALIGEIDYNEIINQCGTCHNHQKTTVKNTVKKILPLINPNDKVIVLQYNDLPNSYTGLICGKISGDFNKPVVIVKDNLIGSLRSPVPVQSIFKTCEYVEWCNGHEESAGIKLNNLEGFREWCNHLELTSDVIYNVTQSFTPSQIPIHLFSEFHEYEELFGHGLPAPTYHIHNIKINSNDIREMGNGSTIKFRYKDLDYIQFFVSKQEREEKWHIGENKDLSVEIVGNLGINSWKGRITRQIEIKQSEVKIRGKKGLNIDQVF